MHTFSFFNAFEYVGDTRSIYSGWCECPDCLEAASQVGYEKPLGKPRKHRVRKRSSGGSAEMGAEGEEGEKEELVVVETEVGEGEGEDHVAVETEVGDGEEHIAVKIEVGEGEEHVVVEIEGSEGEVGSKVEEAEAVDAKEVEVE